MNKPDPMNSPNAMIFLFQTPEKPAPLRETLLQNLQAWKVPPQAAILCMVIAELSGGDLDKLAGREELNRAITEYLESLGGHVVNYGSQPTPWNN